MSSPVDRVVAHAGSVRGTLAILAALALGVLVPPPDAAGALVSPIVVVLVYTALRDFTPGALPRRSAAAVAIALAIGYLAVPGLAVLAGPRLLSEARLIELFPIIAAPTTVGSAIVWTRVDDGDVALTATIAAVSVGLSPLVVPALFAGLRSTAVSLDPLAIGLDLAVVLVGGAALAAVVPDGIVNDDRVDDLSVLAIAALVYVAVGTTGLAGLRPRDLGVIAIAVVLVDAVVLALTAALGRLARLSDGQRRSVVYAAGLKNLAIPLLVAGTLDAGSAIPIVLFYVLQQVAASVRAEVPAIG